MKILAEDTTEIAELDREINVLKRKKAEARARFEVKKRTERHNKKLERELEMVGMYKKGNTLEEIGFCYGVTRQRVQQVLARHCVSKDGGLAKKREEKKRLITKARDERFVEKYGFNEGKFKSVGNDFKLAYRQQKTNAERRGIAWTIKFSDWFLLWEESGKWPERGLGFDKYVLTRKDLRKGFEPENIVIAPHSASSRKGINYAMHGNPIEAAQ